MKINNLTVIIKAKERKDEKNINLIGLTAVSASSVVAMAPIQKSIQNQPLIVNDKKVTTNEIGDGYIANENEWNGINSNLSVSVPATATHQSDNNDTKNILTSTDEISWDNIISKSDTLKINGTFEFATYKEPKAANKLILNLESNSINERIYGYHDGNDKWSGWGHQTSKIDIVVKVDYVPINKSISITLTNYVYIRTAGSTHKSHTTSNISNVTWLR